MRLTMPSTDCTSAAAFRNAAADRHRVVDARDQPGLELEVDLAVGAAGGEQVLPEDGDRERRDDRADVGGVDEPDRPFLLHIGALVVDDEPVRPSW